MALGSWGDSVANLTNLARDIVCLCYATRRVSVTDYCCMACPAGFKPLPPPPR